MTTGRINQVTRLFQRANPSVKHPSTRTGRSDKGPPLKKVLREIFSPDILHRHSGQQTANKISKPSGNNSFPHKRKESFALGQRRPQRRNRSLGREYWALEHMSPCLADSHAARYQGGVAPTQKKIFTSNRGSTSQNIRILESMGTLPTVRAYTKAKRNFDP